MCDTFFDAILSCFFHLLSFCPSCPYKDDRYRTQLVPVGASSGLLYPTHHSRFIFKMFTFVGAAPANPGGKGGKTSEVMDPLREKVQSKPITRISAKHDLSCCDETILFWL